MISVCLATYNGSAFIQQQLESILVQLGADDEIIISDNYSTDETITIIKSLNDSRIKIFYCKQLSTNGSINCIKNFENALQNANGAYIFLSDQDDLWERDKIKKSLALLENYDVVVSDCKIINHTNEVILDSYFVRRNSGKGFWKNLYYNTYLGCCMAFKKEVLNLAMPFPAKIPMHDIWLGFIASFGFKVYFSSEKLVLYREHQNNVSPTAIGISRFNFMNKFFFRFNLIRYLPLIFYRKLIQ